MADEDEEHARFLADEAAHMRAKGFQDWLFGKWTQPHDCPICASDSWTHTDVAHIPAAYTAETFPVVMVTCGVCGYTFFINDLVAHGQNPRRVRE